ncbi:hypothetical protein OIV83_002856 [Microbotryomycetes sp. JL201]|nr:hypothetical protein OIV83_002856 [Microbotryomycetes sp. JL201]
MGAEGTSGETDVLSSPPRPAIDARPTGSSTSSPVSPRRPRLSLGTRFDAPPLEPPSAAQHGASPRPSSRSTSGGGSNRHRHSDAITSALELLKVLAGETSAPAGPVPVQVGIVKCLEAAGWQHQSTTDGVRIFTKAPDHELQHQHQGGGANGGRSDKAMTVRTTTTTDALTQGVGRQAGIRKDEDLPWIRGEAFVQGSWDPHDVAHTILNQSARALWDPRFDAIGSDTVEFLSETDILWSMLVRGELGSDREGALVSTIDLDKRNKTAYVASVSVDDPLLIRQAPRTTIHLNGWCLRSLPRAPAFEQPPPTANEEDSPATPSRPGHRRLKSSLSIKNTGLMSPSYLPPPLPAMDGLSYFPTTTTTNLVRQNSTGADSAHQDENKYKDIDPLDFPQFAVPKTRASLPNSNPPARIGGPDDGPGLHVSFVTHVSPGFNLSQTMVNHLSMHLPLLIASIGRYLGVRGFAPWVQRLPKRDGLVVLDEQYEPLEGTYRLVFRVDGADDGPDTKIRFHGSGFGKGRFEIVVENNIDDWELLYDVEPHVKPETVYVDEHDEQHDEQHDGSSPVEVQQAEQRPQPPRRRKTSMSVKASPLTVTTSLSSANAVVAATAADGTSVNVPPPDMASPLSPTSFVTSSTASPPRVDPAALPGPLGACTLVIPRHSSTRFHPITVTISRNSTTDNLTPLDRLQSVHETLGPAIRSTCLTSLSNFGASSLFDSVEDMLEAKSDKSDKMARLRLKAASDILKQVRYNQEKLMEKRGKGYVEKLASELANDVGHHHHHRHRQLIGVQDVVTLPVDVKSRMNRSNNEGSLGLSGTTQT